MIAPLRGPIKDYKTKNRSFVLVQKQLQKIGIKNNDFHLILLNPALQGVDPHSPDLAPNQVFDIITECTQNIFYYVREVVRIPEQGGQLIPFILDRGSLASLYCFANDINHYLMKPRQTGKTVVICTEMSYGFKFGSTNADMMFSGNDPDIGKKNLKYMKDIIKNLPTYMTTLGHEKKDNTGKMMRKTDNILSYREPGQNNSAMVAKRATTPTVAEKIGRGFSQVYQFFDEAEFTDYIDIIVKVSGMSFNTAANNSLKNGGGACRVFATTPGDLSDEKACQSALKIVNGAVQWNEKFYDMKASEVKKLIEDHADSDPETRFNLIYIEYSYKQLGLGEDWFRKACKNVFGDPVKIRREILLERFSGNRKSPFTESDIQELNDMAKELKIWKKEQIGPQGFYEILLYEKPNRNRCYFIGLDPSDGTGSDNYAMTVMDPYTLKIVAEFRSPYMTMDGMQDIMAWFVKKYTPNCIIFVERNRNGQAMVDRLMNSELRNRLYFSPEAQTDTLFAEQIDDKGFIEEQLRKRKFFGLNTTTTSRDMMIGLLLDAVRFSKDIIVSKYVVEDISNLAVHKTGKIAADTGKHDDNVMSWLICLYAFYYVKDLNRFGFVKGTLPNDVEESSEFAELQALYNTPEIRKLFPSMTSFYENITKAKLEREQEQFTEKNFNSTINLGKLGGINIKDSDLENYQDTSITDNFSIELRNKWTSLNRK